MSTGLMWFRRDLRLHDNTALAEALSRHDRVHCCFVFDREILDQLEDRSDRRVQFIHQCVTDLAARLRELRGRLTVRHGMARKEIPELARSLGVDAVYANHDYEPRCIARDCAVAQALAADGRASHTFKDHVVFEKSELLSQSDTPFRVYTHYKNAWHAKLTDDELRARDCDTHARKLASEDMSGPAHIPDLAELGFASTDLTSRGGIASARETLDRFLSRIGNYGRDRDVPAVEGTSRLSVHLRFGTISIREVVREALDQGSLGARKWVDELVWRDFYNMVLNHWPQTETRPFQSIYNELPWRHDENQFAAWCEGRTGFPIVDAGMRELNATGYMHNRLRMITANFLTKDLLIDWRWGERYFARKLLDYDLSQNLGGWQWSASIGTDAQPYFRVFNPTAQSKRLDPSGDYIRRFVAELRDFPAELIHEPHDNRCANVDLFERTLPVYPRPIVDHRIARAKAIAFFKSGRSADQGP